MNAIKKDNLKGHYVTYQETDLQGGKYRTEKVIKITGNTLTVINCLGRRRRVNLAYVRGCVHHKNRLRGIVWSGETILKCGVV